MSLEWTLDVPQETQDALVEGILTGMSARHRREILRHMPFDTRQIVLSAERRGRIRAAQAQSTKD